MKNLEERFKGSFEELESYVDGLKITNKVEILKAFNEYCYTNNNTISHNKRVFDMLLIKLLEEMANRLY